MAGLQADTFTAPSTLSLADMAGLVQDGSASSRTRVAQKLAASYSHGLFGERERSIALEIIRLLIRDTEVEVRTALSREIAACSILPKDVALALAADTQAVAVPLLSVTQVLDDEDLIAIVQATTEVAKLLAIAQREVVSSPLCNALMATDHAEVMCVLLSNPGAMMEERYLLTHWQALRGHATVLEALVKRGGLPPRIAEKLYTAVADDLKGRVAEQYRLPVVLVSETADDQREWASLSFAAHAGDQPNATTSMDALMEQLYRQGNLTPSLIIRSLCMGDMQVFEAAIARLAGIPRVNARLLMADSGAFGFRALYEQANLPQGFYDAIFHLLKVSLAETEHGRLKREDFHRRVVAQIQAKGYDRTVEQMGYLLTLIGGARATAATLH